MRPITTFTTSHLITNPKRHNNKQFESSKQMTYVSKEFENETYGMHWFKFFLLNWHNSFLCLWEDKDDEFDCMLMY